MGRSMTSGNLFRQVYFRFLLGFVVAFLLFLGLNHLFQTRVVNAEWEHDLRQEAKWLALCDQTDTNPRVGEFWRETHDKTRMTVFNEQQVVIADSHSEIPPPDLSALMKNQFPLDHLVAYEPLPSGHWVVLSRPKVPSFAHGLRIELISSAIGVVVLVALVLMPLIRSVTSTIRELANFATRVAEGSYGDQVNGLDQPGELATLVDAFNNMSTKLSDSKMLNERLLHDVSHELRSPLSRIQIMSETMVLRPESADNGLAGIKQEIALLDRIIGDLLLNAQMDARDHYFQFEEFSLLEWAGPLLGRLEQKAKSLGIEWQSQLPRDDRQVIGDRQRLTQAVGNLAENATKSFEQNTKNRIKIAITFEDKNWSITVEDNGRGIPSADLPHVFRRFYRVGDHRTRSQGGVGLGLGLVKAIVTTHEGEIVLESAVGEFTRAQITIPLTFSGTHSREDKSTIANGCPAVDSLPV